MFSRLRPGLVPAVALAVAIAFAAAGANAQTIVTTGSAGGSAWRLPIPDDGLPTPIVLALDSLPADANPHGVALVSPRSALIADAGGGRLFALHAGTGALLDTIETAPWNGSGSLAVSPDGSVALGSGDASGVESGLVVVESPFSGAPVVRSVALPSSQHVGEEQSAAIRFAPSGRAFVATHHSGFVEGGASPNASFVHVIDPPYAAIAASIELPVGVASSSNFDRAEGLAVTPDGATVLVTNGDRELYVLRAPFSTGMAVETLPLGGVIRSGSSVAASPNGAGALVTDYRAENGFDRVMLLRPPYDTTATSGLFIGGGGAGTLRGFEHVAIVSDGSYAIASGDVAAGEAGDLWLIRAPFGATPSNWFISLPLGERGTGAVEILDPRLLVDGFESGDALRWSTVVP